MRNLILTVALLIAATGANAQSPRTPDGHADFSGTYDIATLTPLVRPANVGGRASLTDAEANILAKAAADQKATRNQASDPNRSAPPAGGDGSEGAAGNVGGYNTLWVDNGTGAFKIEGKWRTSIIVDPLDGRVPQLTPEAAKRAAARASLNRPNRGDAWWIQDNVSPGPYDDPELRPNAERCLLGFGSSAGPPSLPVLYNNLKQIIQTRDTVVILNEMVHDTRLVRINGKHDPAELRRWLGDSVGVWQGDTLVVDTTNFNDQPAFPGATRNLHVVEKFSRIDSKSLLYQFTVDDPTVWTKPWSGEMLWPSSESRVFEYACHEGNYSFANILRGARLLEGEALAAKPHK